MEREGATDHRIDKFAWQASQSITYGCVQTRVLSIRATAMRRQQPYLASQTYQTYRYEKRISIKFQFLSNRNGT